MRRAPHQPRLIAIVAMMIATALVARSEPGAPARDRPGVVALGTRLAALDPSNPMAYFELAEEVAYEAAADADVQLARRLFVLAYELDRAAGASPGFGASTCLALRDLSTNADEKSWLSAMAGHHAAPTPNSPPGHADAARRSSRRSADEAILLAAIHYAAQEPRAAQEILRRPDASAAAATLGKKFPILARIIEESATQTACPECRNRRVSASSIDSSAPARSCPTCGGNPGPRLSEAHYLDWLRLQAELAGARPNSWSADLLLNGEAPIRDADPGALAPYFGVDPRKSKWRPSDQAAGEWYIPAEP